MIASRLLLLFGVCAMAFAGEKDFGEITKAIETHYGVKRTHIPLMGVANFFVKAKHIEGVSGFKIAVFEDLNGLGGDSDFMDGLSGDGGLHRMVRVRARNEVESTYVFAGDAGKATRVLVATFESNEATVIEVKVDANALMKLLADPAHMGTVLSGDRQDRN